MKFNKKEISSDTYLKKKKNKLNNFSKSKNTKNTKDDFLIPFQGQSKLKISRFEPSENGDKISTNTKVTKEKKN